MYTKVKIKNFRGIKELEIDDLKRINLFVGKNNCGKSSILEALFLLTGPTNVHLPLAINSYRGLEHFNEYSWNWIFHKLDINFPIEISGITKKKTLEKRCLKIFPNTEIIIDSEVKKTLSEEILKNTETLSELSPKINGLILNTTFWKKEKKIQEFTSKIRISGGLHVELPKDYKETLKGIYLDSKIFLSNISERFNNIQIQKKVPSIIEVLKEIEPTLNTLVLGANNIIYADIGLSNLIPINCLGNGLVRLLSIIVSIANCSDGIVFIDEIENGLHYISQKILWNAIFQAVTKFNVQIFATTHSMDCVKSFVNCSQDKKIGDDIRLYRLEKEENFIRIIKYNYEILKESLDSEWEVR